MFKFKLARCHWHISRPLPHIVKSFVTISPHYSFRERDQRASLLVEVSFDIPLHLRTNRMGNRLPSNTCSSGECPTNRRRYTTGVAHLSEEAKSSNRESIFSPQQSAWDHVFNDLKDMPPLLPSSVRNPLRSPLAGPRGRTRRQAMTAREISAFDQMFDMIFNTVSEQKVTADSKINGRDSTSDIDIGRGGMSDLFGKLMRHSKRMKWTTEADHMLDRQKEEMDLCDTDEQLLEWAMREVFGESQRYEAASRNVAAQAVESGTPQESPMLQPPTYPHLIALLMRTFRDKYLDPHLALSIFEHVRHLSIPSYVFGCSTQAYNELIETHWGCFRDLKGVYDALEEMKVNGVDVDSRTRKLVDTVRRQVGERNLWVEENDVGSGEVWNMLTKIEELVSAKQTKQVTDPQVLKWDDWKSMPLENDLDDGWEFDQWDRSKFGMGREGRRRGVNIRQDKHFTDGFQ